MRRVQTFEIISGRIVDVDPSASLPDVVDTDERYLRSMSKDVGGSPEGESDREAVRFGEGRVASELESSSSCVMVAEGGSGRGEAA